MISFSKMTMLGTLLAAGALTLAQGQSQPAPAPPPRAQVAPAPPSPAPSPAPVLAPMPMELMAPTEPPEPPEPPEPMIAPDAWRDIDIHPDIDIHIEPFEFAFPPEKQLAMNDQIERAMEKAQEAQEKIAGMNFDFDFKKDFAPMALAYAQDARAYARDARSYDRHGGSDDGLYSSGKRALDEHRWDQALDRFSEVATRGGAEADGALYWKAYSLDRLARRDEALATIAELRKAFPNSRWLDDAKALEVEVRQATGKPAAPETESDDEIKLLALNGLMQSDPDRAFPILENLLKSAQAPRLKKRTLFVLAENGSQRAQQLLERIARGNANPDLQLEAINYMSVVNRKQSNNGQVLTEIYNSSTDAAVKRAVLAAFVSGQDKDRLLQIAKTEKNQDLRIQAIHMLGSTAAQPEMWQLYQAETSPEVKRQILYALAGAGNSEKMLEVARTEKDAGLRRSAIQSIAGIKAPNTSEALVAIYSSDQDKDVKRTIVSVLYSQRNVKALIELGRKETDPDMKRHIVQHLVELKSPEATAFLEEILK
jgi:hypothetical protein